MIYSIFYTHTHFWHQNKRAKLFLRTSIFGGVQLENFTFRTLYKELRTLYKELKEFRSITPVPTLLVWIYLYLKINWRLSLTSSKNPAVHFFVEKNQWYTLSDLHQSINFVNHVFELLVYIFFNHNWGWHSSRNDNWKSREIGEYWILEFWNFI